MKKAFIVILLFLNCIPANAETCFFVGSNFPILSEETAEGQLHGIGIDIAVIICQRIGYEIRIQLYPWLRAQQMVKTGQADVLIAPYKTPEREKWLDYSETHFYEDESFFFVMPNSAISWGGDLASLRGKRIGMVPGWSVGAAFEQMKDTLSIDYAPSLDLCFKKLLAKRVDIIPTQVREATAAFKRLRVPADQRPITLSPVLCTHYNYYGFSKQRRQELSAFKKAFDDELRHMNERGEITSLLKEKYGKSHEAPEQ